MTRSWNDLSHSYHFVISASYPLAFLAYIAFAAAPSAFFVEVVAHNTHNTFLTNNNNMSSATRKAKGSIFAVHCDLEDQPTTASTSSTTRASKRKQSVLANKENTSSFSSSSSSLSSVPTKKSTPFNGKVPFELASPVNTLSDQLSQTLGFFGPEATPNKLQHRRINSMKGDPTKGPAKGVSKSLKLVKGKEVFKVLASEEEQAPPSPVLANVTEAYNGNGGFHYSPIVCRSFSLL